MAQCPRCGNSIGCSCQLVRLPDGTTGCSVCANKANLNTNQAQAVQSSAQELTPAQRARIIQANGSDSQPG